MSGEVLGIGHEHADVTGGWLRPAVFGAMDGLVSNLALVAGVAGGSTEHSAVLLAGLAGLVAGALSMAAGEYTSVAAQSEAAQREISIERAELRRNPGGEQAELAAMYIARGVAPDLAQEVARQIHTDEDRALAVHAREELGVDAQTLPSARLAAASSFASFAVGAALPVLPYLLGATTLLPALLAALVGLFCCGAVVTRVTNRPWWYGGLRQLVLGAAAAGVTYVVGDLVGARLG